jgi:putative SOS response-associated peptidase YedK
MPIRLICSTDGLLCLRSAKTSFWHNRCRRGPSTPTRRNTHWLGPEHRCFAPFTSFSEYDTINGRKVPVWFAPDESRPLLAFAGLWTNWTGVRKAKEGEITADVFAFLTCEPNAEVARVHPPRRCRLS